MMFKKLVFLAAFAVVLTLAVPGALAINYGEPDGNGHPYVGLVVFKDAAGTPLWRCSGTLLSARIFLTAGHCTEAPAASGVIWFEPEILRNDPAFGYPNGGPTSVTGRRIHIRSTIPTPFISMTSASWSWTSNTE
jgi:hypothetical protein